MSALRRLVLLAPLALGSSACVGTRLLSDPTLTIHTQKGDELGVATEHGLVFLGHTATSGRAEVTAWFGDGPSVEPVVIEPVGGGLFTAETEIRLPSVTISLRSRNRYSAAGRPTPPGGGALAVVRSTTPRRSSTLVRFVVATS